MHKIYEKLFSELLGPASETLQDWGRVRAGIAVLEPFLRMEVKVQLAPNLRSKLLGTLGSAYYRLARLEKAIEYHQQALSTAREIGDRAGKRTPLAIWALLTLIWVRSKRPSSIISKP
jgi:tetratricopeptide (TPR) repeat protein